MSEDLRCRCGKLLNGGSRAEEFLDSSIQGELEHKPMERVPGAVVVCFYCAAASMFSPRGILVPMTTFALMKLPKKDRDAVRAMQNYVQALNEANRARN